MEYRIKQEALCFGGDKCTATDIAIAAGIAPQGIGNTVPALEPPMVYAAMREIKKRLEAAIDCMKVSCCIGCWGCCGYLFPPPPLPLSISLPSPLPISSPPLSSPKSEREDVPVILVGGGCILVDPQVHLKGASRVILPADHWVSHTPPDKPHLP